MNGLSLLALIAVAAALVVAYRVGRLAGRRDASFASFSPSSGPAAATDVRAMAGPVATVATVAPVAAAATIAPIAPATPVHDAPSGPPPASPRDTTAADLHGDVRYAGLDTGRSRADAERTQHLDRERARLVIAYEAEAATLRRRMVAVDAERYREQAFAHDRMALLRELATARGEVARYRQVVVDLENDAPPPILGGPGAPDDLKLIVGIGPALERMLQQLGVASYRQIARWTERDIDEFDARLPEFPGRIRRDAWVTQARELHFNKYGERP